MRHFISLIAQNTGRLDNMVQAYGQLHYPDRPFDFDLEVIYLESPNVIELDYWGTHVNTQFMVTFEYKHNDFVLKSFGSAVPIP